MALYNSTFTQIFDGVISSDLSINRLSDLGDDAFEALALEEINGHRTNGIKVIDALIQFGSVDYNNATFNTLQNSVNSLSDISFQNISNSVNIISSAVDDANNVLRDTNLDCLISSGGCSDSDLSQVELPAGQVTIQLEYYLPGEPNANSSYNLLVDLEEAITLPY